jgi:PQQ-like domain
METRTPMREYRDELAAAHQRIAQLEHQTVPQVKPQRSVVSGAVTVAVGLLLVTATTGTLVSLPIGQPNLVDAPPRQAPAPVAPREIWLPVIRQRPIIVDVNADGSPDILGVFDIGAERRVGAIDSDGKPLWSSGPLERRAASSQMFTVVGNLVAVADGGPLHLLALADGTPIARVGERVDTDTVCLAARAGMDRDSRSYRNINDATPFEVLVGGILSQTDPVAKIVDLATGGVRQPPRKAWCFAAQVDVQGGRCSRYDRKGEDSCGQWEEPPFKARGFHPDAVTFREGPFRINSGYTGITQVDGKRSIPKAIGYSAGSRTPTWERTLIDDDVPLLHYTHHAIGAGRFFTAYARDKENVRVGYLASHDVRTGNEQWRASLFPDDNPYPTIVAAALGRVVVVTAGRTLNVFDATTGQRLNPPLQ